jgi:hypothetical protein
MGLKDGKKGARAREGEMLTPRCEDRYICPTRATNSGKQQEKNRANMSCPHVRDKIAPQKDTPH